MRMQLLLVSNLVASGAAVYGGVAGGLCALHQKASALAPQTIRYTPADDRLDHQHRAVNAGRAVNRRLESQFRCRATRIELRHTSL